MHPVERADFIESGFRRFARMLALALACVVSVALFSSPVQAQSARSVEVRTAIFGDLSITHVEDMDFGDIIEDGSGGTIVMTPFPNASCTVSGTLIHTGACQPALFGGSGEDNAIVRIKKPPSATLTLTGPGNDMTVSDFQIDGSPELDLIQSTPGYSRYRINSATGIFEFRVSGTLNVGANQAPGIYTGTFEITIQYN